MASHVGALSRRLDLLSSRLPANVEGFERSTRRWVGQVAGARVRAIVDQALRRFTMNTWAMVAWWMLAWPGLASLALLDGWRPSADWFASTLAFSAIAWSLYFTNRWCHQRTRALRQKRILDERSGNREETRDSNPNRRARPSTARSSEPFAEFGLGRGSSPVPGPHCYTRSSSSPALKPPRASTADRAGCGSESKTCH
jgi:hypothetical protein